MKTKSQKRTSRRFSEVLLETPREDHLLGDSRPFCLASRCPLIFLKAWASMGKIASACVQRTQSTLAGHCAVPYGVHIAPTNTILAIRIAVQRTQVYEAQCLCFGRRYDSQRRPMIQIAAIILSSDSYICQGMQLATLIY